MGGLGSRLNQTLLLGIYLVCLQKLSFLFASVLRCSLRVVVVIIELMTVPHRMAESSRSRIVEESDQLESYLPNV